MSYSPEAKRLEKASRGARMMTIVRVTSGHFLEMFDFILFGFYATSIGQAFFPTSSEYGTLLLTFATFGAGFLMRPIGSLFLGAYVDRVGRRKGLLITLGLMAVGTLLIAFTPNYASIGLMAPLLVLAGRLIQGLSAGAELGNVAIYLNEIAPPGQEGFYVSWQAVGQQIGIILAGVIGYAVSASLARETVLAWGWRVPFVIGSLIVPLLFVLRRSLVETDTFLARTHRPTNAEIFRSVAVNWRVVLAGMFLVTGTSVAFYLLSVYTPTFGRTVLKLSTLDSLMVSVCIATFNAAMFPLMGILSDRIGRKAILIVFSLLVIFTAYPAMCFLVAAPSFLRMLCVLLWVSFTYCGYTGGMYAALTEVVPLDVRTTAWSLAFSLSVATFGGFTPVIVTWLINVLGDRAAPGLWMSFGAACGLGATLYLYRKAADVARTAQHPHGATIHPVG
jgi:MHS family citrate/tricarballylate:H+ symporter-like MFS transporter